MIFNLIMKLLKYLVVHFNSAYSARPCSFPMQHHGDGISFRNSCTKGCMLHVCVLWNYEKIIRYQKMKNRLFHLESSFNLARWYWPQSPAVYFLFVNFTSGLDPLNVCRDRVTVVNATFNNISVISWQSVSLMEETGVPGENHWPATSRWPTLIT